MTESDWKCLTAYVTRLQSILRLDAWDVIIEREPPIPNDGLMQGEIEAQTDVMRDARHAVMRFAANIRESDADTVRGVVTHELLHLPTDWPISDALDQLQALGSEQAYGMAKISVTRAYERMVDALAQAIAPLLPAFSWDTLGSDGPDEPASEEGSAP